MLAKLYLSKVGIKLYKLASYVYAFIILLLVSLLFIAVINPYSFFKFEIFVLMYVCMYICICMYVCLYIYNIAHIQVYKPTHVTCCASRNFEDNLRVGLVRHEEYTAHKQLLMS